jgi:hypothetical protein
MDNSQIPFAERRPTLSHLTFIPTLVVIVDLLVGSKITARVAEVPNEKAKVIKTSFVYLRLLD